METYVTQMFREQVDPLKEDLEDKTLKLEEVTSKAKELEKELEVVNSRYRVACKAIL